MMTNYMILRKSIICIYNELHSINGCFHRQSSTKVQMVQRWDGSQQRTHFRSLFPYSGYPARGCRDISLRRNKRCGIHIQRSHHLCCSL